MTAKAHFCTCPAEGCAKNPRNHGEGCDLCVEKNLTNGEIPACFFLKISPKVGGLTSFTIESFVKFYLERTKNDGGAP